MVKFFDNYRTEILTMLKEPDKIVHYFDSTFWLDHKRYTDAEKIVLCGSYIRILYTE